MPLRTPDALGLLLRPLQLALYCAAGLVPRNPRRWVFGAWRGERFSDNSAALFRHCAGLGDRTVEAIWIAHSREVRDQVRALGLRAHHPWSPRGLLLCLTAGAHVFTSTARDLNFWTCRGARLVHLRHGVGIKRIGRGHLTPGTNLYRMFHGPLWQRALWRIATPWHAVVPDLVAATSPLHAEQAVEYFGVPRERVEILGFPRNDALFAPFGGSGDAALDAWLEPRRARGDKLFFYMPTFRDDGRTPCDALSWAALDAHLEALGAAMLVRLHFADRSGFADELQTGALRNIRLHDPQQDPYRILGAADALVTDYSSVAYDYLLLGRPVIFFTADLDRYTAQRSLWFDDYEQVAPGLRALDPAQLCDALAAVVDGSADVPRAAVEALLEQLQTHRDGQSSARTFEALQRLVHETAPSQPRSATADMTEASR